MLKWSAVAASVILLSSSLIGCDNNPPRPAATTGASAAAPAPTPSSEAVKPPTAASSPAPTSSAAAVPEREIVGALQVLVAFKGAELAPKTVTRSKDDAKKRAEEALGKIKKDNMPFDEAAKKYSDDEMSKKIGGALGNFERNAMPEAFSKVAFALKVGDVSDVVETPRGFHIIKRIK